MGKFNIIIFDLKDKSQQGYKPKNFLIPRTPRGIFYYSFGFTNHNGRFIK